MKVDIKPMEKSHTDECFDLEMECFDYKVRFDKNMLYGRLEDLMLHGMSFVAVKGKKILGHISTFYTRHGDVYIDFLCVKKDFKRKGIGRKLIERIHKENPRSNIYLRTGSNNQSAIKFYLTMGYEIHEVKGDAWKYRDIMMVLKRQ